MEDSDRVIDFGPEASIRTAMHVQVEEGATSADMEVTEDFDYVDLIDGAGGVQTDGINHPLVHGRGTVVQRGSTYRLYALAPELTVMIYSIAKTQ